MAGSWAALDPGRSKCGLVLSDASQGQVIQALIEPAATCLERLTQWRLDGLQGVVIGDGTACGDWPELLRTQGLCVAVVDERGSTLAARQRYWQLFPPRNWRRLLPRGMNVPPRPVDDVAAQLLLERWLGHSLSRAAALEKPLRDQERRRRIQNRARTVKA
ncbi:MAG: resolvase [Cyanobacteriota bacterium]|nr:resolvase [Cyanobacteriota bacterium]